MNYQDGISLSDGQQKIVDLSEGQHLVLAPPGTGKTEILAHRLSGAISKGVPQEQIACLTFTNRAASNMLERAQKELGDNEVFIGNIHSFCNRHLRQNNLIPQMTSLLDEEEQSALLDEAQSDVNKRCLAMFECAHNELGVNGAPTENIRSFWRRHLKQNNLIPHLNPQLCDEVEIECSAIDKHCPIKDCLTPPRDKKLPAKQLLAHFVYLKRAKLQFDSLINFGGIDVSGVFNDKQVRARWALELIHESYESLKSESDYIDFDDLLTLAYLHLSQEDKYRSKPPITWLQVDEAQDLNPLQWAIINKISNKDNSHRVFFGDPEQAIFSFMGVSKRSLELIREDCSVHYLETNYRSPQYMLDLYNQYAVEVLRVEWELETRAFSDISRPDGALRMVSFQGYKDGPKWRPFTQVHECHNIVSKEFPIEKDSTAAILVKENASADLYAEAFEKQHPGMRIFKVSGFDLFGRRITKDALSILNTFSNNRDKLSWARVFHMTTGKTLKKSRSIVNELFSAGVNPLDVLLRNAFKESFLDDFLCAYNTARVVVFDTETTGLDTEEDDIIQIAAIEIIKGTPGKVFEVYIDTNRDFGDAEKIHHISKKHLIEHATDKHLALSSFIDFAGDSPLIAHNLSYDQKILNSNLIKTGLLPLSNNTPFYDSVDIAQRLYPKLPRYKLEYLLDYFNIEGKNSHNAVDDVMATVGLIEHCVSDIESNKISRMSYLDGESSKLLEKFSNNFLPLYELLTSRASVSNLGDATLEVVSYIDANFNSESKKYTPNDYSELEKLIRYMKEMCEERDIIKSIKKHMPDLSKYKEVDLKLEGDNITIATVHKAKGLEFDYVIIPQCAENKYPGFYSIKQSEWPQCDNSGVEEDARLLYVAMTRAKKKLLITCSTDTKVLSGPSKGARFKQEPSRFLLPIRRCFQVETKTL